jgi:glycosyltransferase involved in cell wall biosynthesis
MFNILRLLRSLGYSVTFLPDERGLRAPYTKAVLDLGVQVVSPTVDVRELIEVLAPELDAIVLSRRVVAWRMLEVVQDCAPAVPVVFDTVDLHFVREQWEASTLRTPEAEASARIGRERELALVRAALSTWVVSFDEKELLHELVPEADIVVVPNIHDAAPTPAGFHERTGLLFVGNFHHPPNVDAAQWLLEELFPRVREVLPSLELHLVGGALPDEVADKAGDGVVVHGWVHDLHPLYDRVRLAVAPLRYGAGMKGKVTEALALGVPVVTTSVGVEGMAPAVRDAAIVADDADGLVAAIVDAHGDDDRWTDIHLAAPAVVEAAYGSGSVREVLERTLQDLRAHRRTDT